jgi:hypothetical protein
VTDQHIPVELAQRLQEEEELENARWKKEAEERRFHIVFRLKLDAKFKGYQVFKLSSF